MCTGEGIMEWWNDGMVLKDIMKTVGPGKCTDTATTTITTTTPV